MSEHRFQKLFDFLLQEFRVAATISDMETLIFIVKSLDQEADKNSNIIQPVTVGEKIPPNSIRALKETL